MPLLYIGLGGLLIFLVITGKLQQFLAQVFSSSPPSVSAVSSGATTASSAAPASTQTATIG